MTGAIIPNDWDGSTYKCYRIEWPSSDLWEAILLGQVTEPSTEAYWDAETGNPDEAAEAVVTAYRQTVPDIYTEECDPMIPGIPVPAFRVQKSVAQSLLAATWTDVVWDLFAWELNSPQFNLGTNTHAPSEAGVQQLWQYNLNLMLDPLTRIMVRCLELPGGTSVALTGADNGAAVLTWQYLWPFAGSSVKIQVWSDIAADLDLRPANCNWSGFYAGPTSL